MNDEGIQGAGPLIFIGGLASPNPAVAFFFVGRSNTTAAFVVGTLDILSASGGGGGASRIR